MAFLDGNGVLYLWQKIVNKFVEKVDGKGLSTNDYTTAEKTKLSGIDEKANKTVVEDNLTSTSTTNALSSNMGRELNEKIKAINDNMADLGGGDMLRSVYDTDNDGKVDEANNSEKLGGMSLYQMYDEMCISSLAISGALGAASCDENGVIVPKSKQLVSDENGNLTPSEVDYYPFESILWLTEAKRDAVITLTATRGVEATNNRLQLKLPIKYIDGTIVETPVVSTIEAAPSKLRARTTYTLILVLRGITFNNEGKIDEISCWVPGVKADDSEKLDGYTRNDLVFESVLTSGKTPRGICDKDGVITPDEPWFYYDENGDISNDEAITPSAYECTHFFLSMTTPIILSVTSDIEPVEGKLPLKLKATVYGDAQPDLIIDIPSNSPLRAGKTYNLVLDNRELNFNQTENGFEVTGLKGEIIGFAPDTDTEPTEGSNNFLTSGAVYTALEETVDTVTEIAEGKCKSYVFATVDELDTWLTDSTNTAKLKVGDVFLIKAVDVPDYWWDGTEKQILETTKVDLTAITNAEIDQIIGS